MPVLLVLAAVIKEKERKQAVNPQTRIPSKVGSPPMLSLLSIPRSLTSHHTAPLLKAEANTAVEETRWPHQTYWDTAQQPWAETPAWAAPPGPRLRSSRQLSRCTEARTPLSLGERPRPQHPRGAERSPGAGCAAGGSPGRAEGKRAAVLRGGDAGPGAEERPRPAALRGSGPRG